MDLLQTKKPTHYGFTQYPIRVLIKMLLFLIGISIGTWVRSVVYLLQLEHYSMRGFDGYAEKMLIGRKNLTLIPMGKSSRNVHVVFSTDCSGYQHWQSIFLFYSLRRSGHLGPVTRVVSGCKSHEEDAIRREYESISKATKPKQLRLHFTPSFALPGKNYKYSNKPGGLQHWISHTDSIEESAIALIDPDMVLLRPIMLELGEGMTRVQTATNPHLVEYIDQNNKVQLLRQSTLPIIPSSSMISPGVAAGQHFGIGGLWASAGTKNARKDFKDFNLTAICGAYSPCLNEESIGRSPHRTTRGEADNYFAVGPVYIASTSDWKSRILPKWTEFMPRVHAQYPKLLGEMNQ